jgi:hypothetical protein
MKFRSLIAILTAVILASCGGSSDSPSQVAEKFLTHINKMEFKEAKKYATKPTGEILDMIAGMAGMMGEQEGPKSVTIKSETIDGDKATVTYRSEGKEEDETLNLLKEDGKWLAHMSKEDMAKEDGGDMDMDFGDEGEWSFEEEEVYEETAE